MIGSMTEEEIEVVRLIGSKHFSCGSLARQMKVSRATAAKIIAQLRRKGLRIATTRDKEEWFYFLEAQPDAGLAELIGIGGVGGKDYSISIDEDLLEHLSAGAKKKQAIAR